MNLRTSVTGFYFYIKESITTHQITLLDRVCISTKICEPDDNDPRHRGSCKNCV